MFPQAEDLARYWSNIRNGTDAITEVPDTHWRVADYYDDDPKAVDRTFARRGGFLAPVEFPLLEFGIAPHSLEATDTTQLLGLCVAKRALEDAGYPGDRTIDRDRVSVILGVTGTLELVIPLSARLGHPIWRRALRSAGVDEQTSETVIKRIAASYVGWQENSFPGLLGNVAAGRIANRLDLHGTNCVVDAACASSLGAVSLAMLELAAGRCDMAVTGGLDTFNDIFMYMCFSKTPALSPTGEVRPFDADADGTILGEGLGVLVLKRLADAQRDCDRIYAVIRAIGSSSDGKGQTVYAPSAAGQVKALGRAYQLAGVAPATVELVEAHGTGTKVGDATELAALEEVYAGGRQGSPWCALGSVKSQVGHTKAAAGAAGLIKAALALYHKVVPPTTKVRRPLERLAEGASPFYLCTEPKPWLANPSHPRRSAVSAFGFGGSNFHCILEEAEREKPGVEWDGDVQILAYSADEPEAIKAALSALERCGHWSKIRQEGKRSRPQFRPGHRFRLLLVIERGYDDLYSACALARDRLDSLSRADSSRPDVTSGLAQSTGGKARLFAGIGPRTGQLAMLFPGQGSQYVGMLRELACRFPRMQASLSLANEAARAEGISISDTIYPQPAFGNRKQRALELVMSETGTAQPAIGAVSLGLFRILEDFGVTPDLVGGHSFGELTALCAVGRIDDRSLSLLAQRRGAIMARCAAADGAGAMLAVFAVLDEVKGVLSEHALDLVIANKNAPRECVVSGPAAVIKQSRAIFRNRNIRTHPVPVSAAFHSKAVSGAEASFREVLDSITLADTRIPVFANTTGLPYPAAPESARALLAGQLARPVEFVAQVQEMHRMGARFFLEVGPGATLTALVHSILAGRDHTALAVDTSRGTAGNVYDLACALASLAALGCAVDLRRWDSADFAVKPEANENGLTVRICGANVRPKVRPDDEPRQRPRSLDPNPTGAQDETTAARWPRSSVAEDANQLSLALRNVQDHLIALQRLAQQNADLHRQFLEGQERTHQTFRTLLAHDARLSRALLGRPPTPASPARQMLGSASADVQRAKASLSLQSQTVRRHDETESAGVSAVRLNSTSGPRATRRRDASLESLGTTLIGIAAEKTGYPAEILDLDMQLDADLGIDSIKRIEILAAVQDRVPELRPLNPDDVASFRTLRAIAEHFSGDRAGSGEICTSGDHGDQGLLAPAADPLARVLVETVAEKTGYPVEMLELDLRLDVDLGIDSIKRVEILSAIQDRRPEVASAGAEEIGALGTLRDVLAFLTKPVCQSAKPVLATSDADAQELPGGNPIARVLLDAVADKTGYPIEMLELDMRLDADLGIDSIKRVEILSAVQDQLPYAPTIGAEQFGALNTLRQIVEALEQKPRPSRHPSGTTELTRTSQPAHANRTAHGAAQSEHLDAIPAHGDSAVCNDKNGNGECGFRPVLLSRLHPCAIAREGRDCRADVGLPAGGTIWIAGDDSPLTAATSACLRGRGYRAIAIRLTGAPEEVPTEPTSGLIIVAPESPRDDSLIGNAFRLLRAAGPSLLQSAARGGAALLSVSRLDGCFGVNGLAPSASPTSGALAGMVKTAALEWPGVECKAVDLDSALSAPELAANLLVEELHKRGPSEVGITRQGCTVLELRPLSQQESTQRRSPRLERGDLVVASGGARGITAQVAKALAASFGPRLVMLGRTPAPAPEAEWLTGLHDETELTRALSARFGRFRTPQELAEESRRVLIGREIRRNLAAIAAAGSPVDYRALDLRHREQVFRTLDVIRAEYGPVRGLIHAAGVLADRRISDQTDAQFALVHETKVTGLQNLFDSIDPESLSLLILFSSSTARFGRKGQAAYAAANESLNKWAQRQALRLPRCRVVSYNWGPWAGGMVTGPLKKLFEREGLTLIPPEAGAQLVVDDIRNAGTGPVEVVVLAEHGGASEPPPRAEPSREPARARSLETVLRRTVDFESVPILASHIIDGHGVLPLALMIEWLAEGAVHVNPGLVVSGIDDLRLLSGVILEGSDHANVETRVGKPVRNGGNFTVPVELRGVLPGAREVALARAAVLVADRYEQATPQLCDQALVPYPLTRDEVYQSVLFHGPALQGIERLEGSSAHAIAAWVSTAPSPAEWIGRPMRSTWLTDPLAIDSAFQIVVLWCSQHLGVNSLPTGVARYRQFSPHFPADGARVVAEFRSASRTRACADLEFLDARGKLVARLESYECVIASSLNGAFRRNQLAPVTSGDPERN
jgi:acyl transferase domain-containing protein